MKGTTEEYQLQLRNDKLIGLLAFLIVISNHLNVLNIKLVGPIEDFHKKLVLFWASLQRNDATHFPSCSELL